MSTIRFGFTAQQIVDEGRTTWTDVNLLKTWLKTEMFPKLTDEQIVLFLLSCLNKQAPTGDTIKAYFRVKNRCPEMFNDRTTNREDVQKQLKTVYIHSSFDIQFYYSEICCFPERTDDGYCVVLLRLYDINFRNFELGPIDKLLTMTLEAAVYDHPPTGLVVIIDMKGTSIMHMTKLRLGLVKTFLEYVQQGLPLRLKKIHIINTTFFVDKLMFLLNPFLKQEVIDMIKFHPSDMDMEGFYEKCIPRRCLPEDYGGNLLSIRILHQQNIDKLTSLETYFKEEEIQRCGVDSK